MRSMIWVVLLVAACTGPMGPTGPQGPKGADGANGTSCSVKQQDDGALISCADGTSAFVSNGKDGKDGANGTDGSCSVHDNGDGTKTISCSDGTSVTVSNGQDGTNGTDGQNGSDGQNGKDGIFRFTPEPAGPHCTLGGTKVDWGLDQNGDGTLESSEVTQTTYVCNGELPPGSCQVLEGDYTINNSLDVQLLQNAGCTEITGNLTINTTGMTTLAGLTQLTKVDGQVNVGSADLESVNLPSLQEAGSVRLTGDHLQSVDLSGLKVVDQNFNVQSLALQTLDLTNLQQVGANFTINTVGNVTKLNLPALTTVAGAFIVEHLNVMDTLDAHNLKTVGSDLYIYGNPALTSLRLDALSSVNRFDVDSNQLLPECQVTAILGQLPSGTPSTTTGNNNNSPTCQ